MMHQDAGPEAQQVMTGKASLASLPAEILNNIASQFCLHCRWDVAALESSAEYPDDDREIRKCTGALAQLSRTCTRLRGIANAYLYHWPQPHPGGAASLVRTLAVRPDLANCVQGLRIKRRFWHPPYPEDGFAERQFSDDQELNFWEDLARTNLDTNLMADRFDMWPFPRKYSQSWHEYNCHEVLVVLAISQTPNIVSLEVELNSGMFLPVSRTLSLPVLRTLKFDGRGDDLKYPDLDCMQQIVWASPSLESLSAARMVLWEPQVESAGVTSLVLGDTRAVLPAPDEPFLPRFPNMTRLSLGVCHFFSNFQNRERDPDDVFSQLVLEAHNLVHLELDFTCSVLDPVELSLDRAISKLGMRDNLQTLSIRCCLATDGLTEEDGSGGSGDLLSVDVTRLTRYTCLLPPSIRAFSITPLGTSVLPFPKNMMHLAAAAPSRFPNLRMVRLGAEHVGERPVLEFYDAFAEQRIARVPGDGPLWKYL